MSRTDVIRAWRDPEFRSTLSSDQLAALPSHPVGLIELSDDELASAAGLDKVGITVLPPCSVWTFHNIVRCCPI